MTLFLLQEAGWGFRLASATVQPLMLHWASCWAHARMAGRGGVRGPSGSKQTPVENGEETGFSGVSACPHSSGTGAQRLHPCHMTGHLPSRGHWEPWQGLSLQLPLVGGWAPAPAPLLGLRGRAGSPSVQTALAPSLSERVLFPRGLENTAWGCPAQTCSPGNSRQGTAARWGCLAHRAVALSRPGPLCSPGASRGGPQGCWKALQPAAVSAGPAGASPPQAPSSPMLPLAGHSPHLQQPWH